MEVIYTILLVLFSTLYVLGVILLFKEALEGGYKNSITRIIAVSFFWPLFFILEVILETVKECIRIFNNVFRSN